MKNKSMFIVAAVTCLMLGGHPVHAQDAYSALKASAYKWLYNYSDLFFMGEGLFFVRDRDGNELIVDGRGKPLVAQGKYNDFFPFDNGKAIVGKDKGAAAAYGGRPGESLLQVIDTHGRECLPSGCLAEWDEYFGMSLSEGIMVRKGGKYGLIDESGIAIPCVYDSVAFYHQGKMLAQQDGKWMVAGKEGVQPVNVSFGFDAIDPFSFETGIASVSRGGQSSYGIVSLYDGRVMVPFEYDFISILSPKLALLQKGEEVFMADLTDGEIEKTPYKNCFISCDGYTIVVCQDASSSEREVYAVLNDEGQEVISPSAGYDNCIYVAESGMFVVSKNEHYGIIGKKGEVVVPLAYRQVGLMECDSYQSLFSEGLVRVYKDEKFGFVDLNGQEVIPCQYDDAYGFEAGLALVSKDSKYGFINHEGKEVVPCKCSFAYRLSDRFLVVTDNNLCALLDNQGRELTPMIFDSFDVAYQNLAVGKIKKPESGSNDDSTVLVLVDDKGNSTLSSGKMKQKSSRKK